MSGYFFLFGVGHLSQGTGLHLYPYSARIIYITQVFFSSTPSPLIPRRVVAFQDHSGLLDIG